MKQDRTGWKTFQFQKFTCILHEANRRRLFIYSFFILSNSVIRIARSHTLAHSRTSFSSTPSQSSLHKHIQFTWHGVDARTQQDDTDIKRLCMVKLLCISRVRQNRSIWNDIWADPCGYVIAARLVAVSFAFKVNKLCMSTAYCTCSRARRNSEHFIFIK